MSFKRLGQLIFSSWIHSRRNSTIGHQANGDCVFLLSFWILFAWMFNRNWMRRFGFQMTFVAASVSGFDRLGCQPSGDCTQASFHAGCRSTGLQSVSDCRSVCAFWITFVNNCLFPWVNASFEDWWLHHLLRVAGFIRSGIFKDGWLHLLLNCSTCQAIRFSVWPCSSLVWTANVEIHE